MQKFSKRMNSKSDVFISLSPSADDSRRFSQRNRRDFRDTNRKACKSLRFGGNWLVANEPRRLAVFRQNGLHAECSPLSLSLFIYIHVCFENGIRAFEKATFAKNGEKKRKYLTQRMPCFRKFAELSRLIVDNWVFELIERGDDSRVNEVRVIRVVSRTAFLKIVVVKFRAVVE